MRIRIEDLRSRLSCCTPGVITTCVGAVASEANLEGVIPGFSAQEVALVARDACEAAELFGRPDAFSELASARELSASDWTLALVADTRFSMGNEERKRGEMARAEALAELGCAALEQAAASSDRSRVLWYEDIYFEAAQRLVRRGDRTGLTRQVECVAETLTTWDDDNDNVVPALRDLAFFQLDLGEHRTGLGLLAALHRNHPSDIWSFNAIAAGMGACGLPSVARLAAERGLALIERESDRERLRLQLGALLVEIGTAADRSEAPLDAVDELRNALRSDLAGGPTITPRELAMDLVPELANARVKQLPPMPSPRELAEVAARLRQLNRAARDAESRQPATHVSPALREAPKPKPPEPRRVGRNEPCPCGSGRKFKKCCGQ